MCIYAHVYWTVMSYMCIYLYIYFVCRKYFNTWFTVKTLLMTKVDDQRNVFKFWKVSLYCTFYPHSQSVNILEAVTYWAVEGFSHLWRSGTPDEVRLRSSTVPVRSVVCGLLSDFDVHSPQCCFQVSIFPPCRSACCLSCRGCETCWCWVTTVLLTLIRLKLLCLCWQCKFCNTWFVLQFIMYKPSKSSAKLN